MVRSITLVEGLLTAAQAVGAERALTASLTAYPTALAVRTRDDESGDLDSSTGRQFLDAVTLRP